MPAVTQKGSFKAPNMRRALAAYGAWMKTNIVLKAFNKQADPVTGKAWKPLSAKTLARRGIKGSAGADGRIRDSRGKFVRGAKILRDTGRLLNQFAAQAPVVTDTSVTLSTNGLVYAATHQFGRGKIPARPFLGFNAEAKQALRDFIQAELQR